MSDNEHPNPSFLYPILEDFVSPYLPICPVFQNNFSSLVKNFIENSHKTREKNGTTQEEKNALFISALRIDLYQSHSKKIFQDHGIKDNQTKIISALEGNCIIYLGTIAIKAAGDNYQTLTKSLKDIETASVKFMKVVKGVDVPSAFISLGALLFDEMLSAGFESEDSLKSFEENNIGKRVVSLTDDLEYFSEIQMHFANTRVGKWLQKGVRGPKQNSALYKWILAQAEIWVFDLNREFIQNGDSVSGRENFLKFVEDCMYPMHPDILETDAIRNVFEKMRQSGQLDYLQQK